MIHKKLRKKSWINYSKSSNKVVEVRSKVAFPTGRDSATFQDNGTEVFSLSRDKGTTGQAKNLTKGRAGTAKIRDGTGRDSQNPGRDAGQNGTEQKRTF